MPSHGNTVTGTGVGIYPARTRTRIPGLAHIDEPQTHHCSASKFVARSIRWGTICTQMHTHTHTHKVTMYAYIPAHKHIHSGKFYYYRFWHLGKFVSCVCLLYLLLFLPQRGMGGDEKCYGKRSRMEIIMNHKLNVGAQLKQ